MIGDRAVSRIGLVLALGFSVGLASAVDVDPALPDYRPVEGLAGTRVSIGSDVLNSLMTFWVEEFAALQPGAHIEIQGRGSATAPPALVEGTAHLGPMTRAMKPGELAAFVQKWGRQPTLITVAGQALTVLVNADNPVKSLTLTQLDSVFSSTRKRGGGDAATWGDLGLTGEWAARPITLYGNNSASGTYGFFKQHALLLGDFKATMREQPSGGVYFPVGKDRGGIGYAGGLGYASSSVRAVPLVDADGKAIDPGDARIVGGTYPLTRAFYIAINQEPGVADALVNAFLTYVLSKQGQRLVVRDGYLPLDAGQAAEQRAVLK
jgi:phosphate transport system substrate-binding protein